VVEARRRICFPIKHDDMQVFPHMTGIGRKPRVARDEVNP